MMQANTSRFEAVRNAPSSMFTDITQNGTQAGNGATNAPQGQNPPPQQTANPAPSESGPLGNTVPVEEAFKGADHTKIPAFTASGMSGQPGSGSGQPLTPQNNVSLGGIVEGKWAVEIVDALLPAGIVAVCYMMDIKLRKTELQLSQKEKDVLAPIWQKCLDSILLNFGSPWTALAVTMGAIYGGKLMEKGVVAWVDKKQEKKEAEALRAKLETVEGGRPESDVSNQSADDIMNGKVAVPGRVPYSEDDIKRRMKEGKCTRDKAIRWLNKKYGVVA
jgi:hypothetical protein